MTEGARAGVERHGLFFLHPQQNDDYHPADYNVDIVAIHGLNGDAYRTWTDDGGHLWLRDSLPGYVPQARVMTFGYDSAVMFGSSRSSVNDFAIDLAVRLEESRRQPSERKRPLIFVCHSLGGVVFKSFLIQQSLQAEDRRHLGRSVYGVVFLGCPHRGSRAASHAQILSTLINTAFLGRGIRSDLIKGLKISSSELNTISNLATNPMKTLAIVSFYEQKPMGPSLIVEPFSAILGLANERAIPINADHRDIARVSPKRPHRYLPVWTLVKELVDGSRTNLQANNLDLLNFLFCLDFQAAQIRPRQPQAGTCEWIFADKTYQNWLHSEKASMILLTGKAGSGKSVLTRCVIERILSGSPGGTDGPKYIGASYFCSYAEAALNGEEVVLKTILHQLVQAKPESGAIVKERMIEASFESPDFFNAKLWTALWDVLSMPALGSTFIVLDAIDELGDYTAESILRNLWEMVRKLSSTHSSNHLRIFVSSRPKPVYSRRISNLDVLPIKQDVLDKDIEVYLQAAILDLSSHNPSFANSLTPELQTKISHHMVVAADGRFLAAVLAWEEFRRGVLWSPEVISNKLERLALDVASLYASMLARIHIDEINDALEIFSIMAAAARPVCETELGTILGMARSKRPNKRSTDFTPFQNLSEIIGRSFPDLITIQNDGKLAFVHMSFKDYLERTKEYEEILRWGRRSVARACVEYVAMQDLIQTAKGGLANRKEVVGRYPLLPYARSQFVWHMQGIPLDDSLWLTFADAAGEDSIYTLDVLKDWDGKRYPSPLEHILHKVPAPGMFSLIRKLHGHGYDLNEGWSAHSCGAPLQHCCAEAGHDLNKKRAALLLLELGANPNLPEKPRWTNIGRAFEGGVWDLYEELFSHPMTDLSARDALGQTLLHQLVRSGSLELIMDMLDVIHEVDLTFQDHNGFTPLHTAATSGRLEVVQILLQTPGIRLDIADKDGRTPLTLATYWGLNRIALALIHRPEAIHLDNADQLKALVQAAKHGDKKVCESLLELCRYQTLHSYPDESGKGILHYAAIHDWYDVLSSCLRRGGHSLRMDHIDHSGRTALHYAATLGNIQSCRVLVEGGASLTQQDRNGKTAAQSAADAGFKDTLMLIIQSGRVDPNQRDIGGRNLVHWAATIDCLDVMEIIAAVQGVKLDQPDKYGKTPIDIAFICKSKNVGQYLGSRLPHLNIYSWDDMYCSPMVLPEEVSMDDFDFAGDLLARHARRQRVANEEWEKLRKYYPEAKWGLVKIKEKKPEQESKPCCEGCQSGLHHQPMN